MGVANRSVLGALLVPLVASLLLAGGARAHSERHGAPPPFDAAKAEQQAFGIAADPKRATRTIRITMDDKLRYSPARISVKQGEVVRLVVSNRGKAMHELVLGTRAELLAHAEMMKRHPDMEHDEPHMAHVAPGRSVTITWRFNRAGEFLYGCLLPGHFEGGMVGHVDVRP